MPCLPTSISVVVAAVVLTLERGAEAEEMAAALNKATLHGAEIDAQIQPCATMLCVARLPSRMNDSRLRQLARVYGKVQRCAVMRNSAGEWRRRM